VFLAFESTIYCLKQAKKSSWNALFRRCFRAFVYTKTGIFIYNVYIQYIKLGGFKTFNYNKDTTLRIKKKTKDRLHSLDFVKKDSDNDISYNNVWNNEFNYSSGFTGGMGNISEDPLFVSPENGIFTLQPNSPCRGAGLWNAHLDIDNSPGSRIDMGAFIGPAN